jgi:hypothetical protein
MYCFTPSYFVKEYLRAVEVASKQARRPADSPEKIRVYEASGQRLS